VILWSQSLIVMLVNQTVKTLEQEGVVIVSKAVEHEVGLDPGVLQTS
jgi:hypothetical protein